MGVKKRDIQRRWWRITIGATVLLGIVFLFNSRSVMGLEGQSCREWASVGELIPPVVAYEFDSSEWNPIDEVNYELDPNLESEAYRIVSNEDGIKVPTGIMGIIERRVHLINYPSWAMILFCLGELSTTARHSVTAGYLWMCVDISSRLMRSSVI